MAFLLLGGLFKKDKGNEVSTSVTNTIVSKSILMSSQQCFSGIHADATLNAKAKCNPGKNATFSHVTVTSNVDLSNSTCTLTSELSQITSDKLNNSLKSQLESKKDGLAAMFTQDSNKSVTNLTNTLRQENIAKELETCMSDISTTAAANIVDYCDVRDVDIIARLADQFSTCAAQNSTLQQAMDDVGNDVANSLKSTITGPFDFIKEIVMWLVIGGIVASIAAAVVVILKRKGESSLGVGDPTIVTGT